MNKKLNEELNEENAVIDKKALKEQEKLQKKQEKEAKKTMKRNPEENSTASVIGEGIDKPLVKQLDDEIVPTKKAKYKKKRKKITKESFTKDKMRKFMLGSKDDMGFLKKLFVYVILISVGFIFIFPLLKMISTSMMTLSDLLDASIKWIPSTFNIKNYQYAMNAMGYWGALKDSFLVSGIPTLCQVVICALIGYGIARYNFKGKSLVFILLIVTFVLPSQLTMLPTYVLYNSMGLVGSLKAFIIPAILGQGLKSQLFILICWSFFKQIPVSLIEAARIDGAGHIKTFLKVAIPSAIGALVVVFLFSFVWYWNEQYLSHLYLYKPSGGAANYSPLINEMITFDTDYASSLASQGSGSTTPTLNTSIKMAATILTITPLLVIYMFLQKQFVESVDRAGITGE